MTQSPAQIPQQIFPDDVLQAPVNGATWRVAHTKSRREKKLVDFLTAHGIAYYLPLFKRRQPGQKRSRYSFVPAFGNYVFVKATDSQRFEALRSNHIARFIEVRDQQRLVHELQQIQSALVLEERVYPYDYVSQGQQVRIMEGPFKGLEGVIAAKKSGYRLVLSVASIFQSVALDIDAEDVEPLGETAGKRFLTGGQR